MVQADVFDVESTLTHTCVRAPAPTPCRGRVKPRLLELGLMVAASDLPATPPAADTAHASVPRPVAPPTHPSPPADTSVGTAAPATKGVGGGGKKNKRPPPPLKAVAQLVKLGFSEEQCRAALAAADGDMNTAANTLFCSEADASVASVVPGSGALPSRPPPPGSVGGADAATVSSKSPSQKAAAPTDVKGTVWI